MNLKHIVEELVPSEWWTDFITGDTVAMEGRNGITYFEGSKERSARILINESLLDMPLSLRASTWHEICHAEPWIKEGRTDGHGMEWLDRLFRHPFLALWNLTIEKILTINTKRRKPFNYRP